MNENLQRLESGAFQFPSLGNVWGVEVRGDAVEVTPVADYLARGLAAVRRGQAFEWALVIVRGTLAEAQEAKRILIRERKAHREQGVSGVVGAVREGAAEPARADGVAARHVPGGRVGDMECGEGQAVKCPGCHKEGPQIVVASGEEHEQVQCLICCARGPRVPRVFDGHETAWQAWERMAGAAKPEDETAS